jgi:hypothetical protein
MKTTMAPKRNRKSVDVRRGSAPAFVPLRESDLFLCHVDVPFLKLSFDDGFGVFRQVNGPRQDAIALAQHDLVLARLQCEGSIWPLGPRDLPST